MLQRSRQISCRGIPFQQIQHAQREPGRSGEDTRPGPGPPAGPVRDAQLGQLRLSDVQHHLGMHVPQPRPVTGGMPQYRQQPRHYFCRARRQQPGRLDIPEPIPDHIDQPIGHRRHPLPPQQPGHMPPGMPRGPDNEGGDLPGRRHAGTQPGTHRRPVDLPYRIIQGGFDGGPVTGHHGHEHRDLTLEPVTAVKITRNRIQATRSSQLTGPPRQHPHPLRVSQRVQLAKQRSGIRTHNRHYPGTTALIDTELTSHATTMA